MTVLVLRSLTVTKEEATVVRVALAALSERGILSDEGRVVLRSVTAKAEEVIASFPTEPATKEEEV